MYAAAYEGEHTEAPLAQPQPRSALAHAAPVAHHPGLDELTQCLPSIAPDVDVRPGEVDLIPFQINGLTHPEPMSSHQQDQGCVTLAIAALTRGADELS
jgi:hypothetical protein